MRSAEPISRQAEEGAFGILDRDEAEGAYRCNYSQFVDVYRWMVRMSERNHIRLCLLLCTLKPDRKEQEIISGHQMERFGKLLEKSIRCSDVYTRYSLNKYLVLLTDFGEKQAAEVAVQLCQNWKAFEKEEKVRIELEIQEVEAASEKNNI